MKYTCTECGNTSNLIEEEDRFIFEHDEFETVEFLGVEIGISCAYCKHTVTMAEFIEDSGLSEWLKNE